jgi:hypothetical protein
MGRPLAKRFFGNRNFGSSSTAADDGLGGSSVASVTIDTPGSYTTRPTVTFSVPDLTGIGAVRATGTTNMEALSATVVDGKTGYAVGDLLTITGAGGAIAYVATIDGDGTVLTVNFTGTGAARGDQTSLTDITTGVATTTDSEGGTVGVTLNVAYRVKSITITEAGSGYTDATDAAVTFSAGTAAGTVVLTADTTAITGRQEAAIVAYAQTTSGGSNLIADIQKQVSTRRYKVETADGVAVCKLVTDGVANAAGEMTITATDVNGNTYYVSKLTRHRATLVRLVDDGSDEDWVYATGASAPWSFAAADGAVVQIANK